MVPVTYVQVIQRPEAALLVHPLLADAAYVALKPAEWIARVVEGDV